MPNSGWLVKATHDDGPLFVTGLRARKNEKNEDCGPGYQELVVDLAETFDLIPSSVMVFSLHQGTKLNVHLGSQGDLDVVLAEAMEWGSHVISVSVRIVSASTCANAEQRLRLLEAEMSSSSRIEPSAAAAASGAPSWEARVSPSPSSASIAPPPP